MLKRSRSDSPGISTAAPFSFHVESTLMTSFFGNFARAAANTAWGDSTWAITHIQPHAGRVLRIEVVPPFATSPMASFSMRVSADGNWETVASADRAAPDATLRLTARAGFELARLPDKPGAKLDLTGDPEFVAAVRDLHDVLPLAIEDRVAAIAGPIAAHALMTTLRSFAQWPGQAADRVGAGTATWMSDEPHLLVARPLFDRFATDVEALAARLNRFVEQHRL